MKKTIAFTYMLYQRCLVLVIICEVSLLFIWGYIYIGRIPTFFQNNLQENVIENVFSDKH